MKIGGTSSVGPPLALQKISSGFMELKYANGHSTGLEAWLYPRGCNCLLCTIRKEIGIGKSALLVYLYSEVLSRILFAGGEHPIDVRSARVRRRLLRHGQQQLRVGRGYHGE